jgi:hypothetical protein
MKRAGCAGAVAVAVPLLFLFGMMGALAYLEVPFQLAFGWIPSAMRLARACHPNLGLAVLFLIALTIFVAGTHRFAVWVYGAAHGANGRSRLARWRWKWTFCGCGIGLCSLAAITSMVLTTHQLHWLSQSTSPWFEDRFRNRALLVSSSWAIWNEAETNGWSSAKTREAFWSTSNYDGALAEFVQPIWIERDADKLDAILLLPRRPLAKHAIYFALLQPGSTKLLFPLKDLPATLARFGMEPQQSTTNAPQGLLP